jgi:hypothetical protein
MLKKLLSLEPVFAAGTVQAVLALVVALGFHLSAGVTGGIEAVAAAVLALIAAAVVNKVSPVLFTGLLSAVGTLLIAFGVPHVSGGLVSAANGVLVIVLTSLLREKVSPLAAPAKPTRVPPAPPAPPGVPATQVPAAA